MSEGVKNPFDGLIEIVMDENGGENSSLQSDLDKFFVKGQKAAASRINAKLKAIQNWAKETKKTVSVERQRRKAEKSAGSGVQA